MITSDIKKRFIVDYTDEKSKKQKKWTDYIIKSNSKNKDNTAIEADNILMQLRTAK